jgi:hypothetical protein
VYGLSQMASVRPSPKLTTSPAASSGTYSRSCFSSWLVGLRLLPPSATQHTTEQAGRDHQDIETQSYQLNRSNEQHI